jgi:P-type conjugative transfer protein TrbG
MKHLVGSRRMVGAWKRLAYVLPTVAFCGVVWGQDAPPAPPAVSPAAPQEAMPPAVASTPLPPPPVPTAADAAVVLPPAAFAGRPSDYLSPQGPLTAGEAQALEISRRWLAASASGIAPRPVAGTEGAVVFAFGASQPDIVCAVLQVCDIAMQPGEQVNSINIGDSARWQVSPAVSGAAPSETEHLIVKPLDSGLETSLVVTTDRRTYHINLVSRRTDYMPFVAFTYPADVAAEWAALRARVALETSAAQAQLRRDTAMPDRGAVSGSIEYLGDLHFNYSIRGAARWRPLRVYNDGSHTVIEMPASLSRADAPALLVVRRGGKVSSPNDTSIVNYRLQDKRYIVDEVFDEAVLVSGVGHHQDRVTIVRKG